MTARHDIIGELWTELQKTEERLRSVGGGVTKPALDCFVPETHHDTFEATMFTALSDADLRNRINREQPHNASMVAAVVADIDGHPSAQLSPMFARGQAALAAAAIDGQHSQWTPPIPESAKPAAAMAAKAQRHREQTPKSVLKQAGAGAKPSSGKLSSASAALATGALDGEPLGAAMAIDAKLDNLKVPEPRADRDLPAIHANASDKAKRIKGKRPLWLRILWG